VRIGTRPPQLCCSGRAPSRSVEIGASATVCVTPSSTSANGT